MTQPGAALRTDHYEFTMLSAFVADGCAQRPAVFECFARRLPRGRRYGVVGGVGRLLDLIGDFRFNGAELDFLLATGAITPAARDYLADFRFRGDIDGYREGELYFPGSPVFTVSATLGEAVLLETLVLSVLNHDSAVMSAAARMRSVAEDRPLIEMGGRRTHEDAALAAARAAYVAGFAATSNLAAGMRWGIPTTGTAAHAFTLAHASERAAFQSQIAAAGPGTTLLVDTYDIEAGIRTAIDVAGPELGAIRIDSGDLAEESRRARALLDSLGAADTRIVVTSDLDEYVIAALADSPIDSYGVGTRLVTGSGHPTASMVYKLVAIADSTDPGAPLRPVEKRSAGKASSGGRKVAWRSYDSYYPAGVAVAEHFSAISGASTPALGEASWPAGTRPLQLPLVRRGERLHNPSLAEIRDFHSAAMAELSASALAIADGDPAMSATAAEIPIREGVPW